MRAIRAIRSIGVPTFAWLAISAVPTGAQDVPPKPIDELMADFVRSPGEALASRIIYPCPVPGTWQYDLLHRLLAQRGVPATEVLAVRLGLIVQRCDISEVDAWFRQRLRDTRQPTRIHTLLASRLYRSDEEENKRIVREMLFDPTIDGDTRREAAALIIVDVGVAESYRMIATGYREHGTAPPPTIPNLLLTVANHPNGSQYEDEVRIGREELLDALLARPDGTGAVPFMNEIMSSAMNLPANDAWFQRVGAVVREIARGERAASPALRSFVAARVGRFGG